MTRTNNPNQKHLCNRGPLMRLYRVKSKLLNSRMLIVEYLIMILWQTCRSFRWLIPGVHILEFCRSWDNRRASRRLFTLIRMLLLGIRQLMRLLCRRIKWMLGEWLAKSSFKNNWLLYKEMRLINWMVIWISKWIQKI